MVGVVALVVEGVAVDEVVRDVLDQLGCTGCEQQEKRGRDEGAGSMPPRPPGERALQHGGRMEHELVGGKLCGILTQHALGGGLGRVGPPRFRRMRTSVLLATTLLLACTSAPVTPDSGHLTGAPSCDAIITACHPFDMGTGELAECHELAHDSGVEATCAPERERCVALCEAAAGDAGVQDAGG